MRSAAGSTLTVMSESTDPVRLRVDESTPKTLAWMIEKGVPLDDDGVFLLSSELRPEQHRVWNDELDEQAEDYFSQQGNVWNEVRTFADLQHAMIRFVSGEEPMTPWHAAALNEESSEIQDKLIRINELGAITFGSQPGRDDQWGRQRAYLQVLVDDALVPTLRTLADANGLVFASNPHQALEPAYGQFTVTEDSDGEGHTFAPIGIGYPIDSSYPSIPAIQAITASTTTVDLADTDWNINRLFDLVIGVLESRSVQQVRS